LKNVERRSRRKWRGGCAHKKYEEMAGYGRSSASPSSLSEKKKKLENAKPNEGTSKNQDWGPIDFSLLQN
jgi:hypothetical protein